MASGIYHRLFANWMNKEVDMEADTIKVMLLNNSHSFVATHNQKSEIVANEIAGAGYTAGGKALAGKSVTQAATTKWDATDIEWTAATFSARHAAIYDETLDNDDLFGSIDFGEEKIVAAGMFKIQWHVSGIVTLTAA